MREAKNNINTLATGVIIFTCQNLYYTNLFQLLFHFINFTSKFC